jgi:hypothetical protein
MVAHVCNPTTQEAEIKRTEIQGQPGQTARASSQPIKSQVYNWALWLMPVVPATQEAEIRRIPHLKPALGK